MFQKDEAVFVKPLNHAHPLRKFSGCSGKVVSVLSAGFRTDEKKDMADSITVLFEDWDGLGGEISERFDETDLGYDRRSIEVIKPYEWDHERRSTFFDRLKKRMKR